MFFTFHQYHYDTAVIQTDNLTKRVIIESDYIWEVNEIAQRIGIVFRQKEPSFLKNCYRWYPIIESSQGTRMPEICGKSPTLFNETFVKVGDVFCIVHYKTGKKEVFKKTGSKKKTYILNIQ